MLARVFPRPLGALAGGHFAQKTGSRRAALCLVGTQIILACLLLGAVVIRQPVVILAVVVLQQCAGSALVPTVQALIPEVVEDRARAAVLARNALAVGVSVVVGPPLGAALLTLTSPAATVLLDICSFGAAFALLVTVRTRGPVKLVESRDRASSGVWRRVREDRVLFTMAAGMVGCYATVTALQASLVLAAVERIGSANGVGLLYSAVGVGAIAGGIAARRSQRATAQLSACMAAEMVAVIALTQTNSLALSLILLGAVAAAGSLIQVGGGMVVMKRVETGALASVNGVIFACGYSGMGLGALVALAGSHLRWEVPVLLCAGATVAVFCTFRLTERRGRIPRPAAAKNAAMVANSSA